MRCRNNYFLILVFALFGFGSGVSQDIDLKWLNDFKSMNFDTSHKDLIGSPYLMDEYAPAKISITDLIYSVKYNLLLDQMEVLINGTKKALPLTTDYTVNFVNLDKTYRVFANDTGKNGFYVLLFDGEKADLLVKEEVRFYDEKIPRSSYEDYQPPRLKREKDDYYISTQIGIANYLSSKKKDFYAVFGENSGEMKSYVKSNKLNIKEASDLIEIVKYYNQL